MAEGAEAEGADLAAKGAGPAADVAAGPSADVAAGPDDALFGYIERFAVLVAAGFPPMPARVFVALLVTDSGRLSAAELAAMLRISPAAVSGAVRYLIQLGLVHKERVPGSRRDYYRMPGNMWDDMIRMRHEYQAFSDRFLAHMLTRNIRIEEDLVDQLFNSSEKRLARTLLLLARYGKEDTTQRVLPKLSQETLAEMVGTTRSRVNFFMNKFRKLGLIEYNGGLKVNSSLLSIVLHD